MCLPSLHSLKKNVCCFRLFTFMLFSRYPCCQNGGRETFLCITLMRTLHCLVWEITNLDLSADTISIDHVLWDMRRVRGIMAHGQDQCYSVCYLCFDVFFLSKNHLYQNLFIHYNSLLFLLTTPRKCSTTVYLSGYCKYTVFLVFILHLCFFWGLGKAACNESGLP